MPEAISQKKISERLKELQGQKAQLQDQLQRAAQVQQQASTQLAATVGAIAVLEDLQKEEPKAEPAKRRGKQSAPAANGHDATVSTS